ncbi:hypothetical protein VNO77_03238 [Canavalia gladiata]|uniref:Uncharacterized protein n=1 Tax=Canavalia gladiata TaxID=3824 RepID=A0AAN9R6Q2_CANGL
MKVGVFCRREQGSNNRILGLPLVVEERLVTACDLISIMPLGVEPIALYSTLTSPRALVLGLTIYVWKLDRNKFKTSNFDEVLQMVSSMVTVSERSLFWAPNVAFVIPACKQYAIHLLHTMGVNCERNFRKEEHSHEMSSRIQDETSPSPHKDRNKLYSRKDFRTCDVALPSLDLVELVLLNFNVKSLALSMLMVLKESEPRTPNLRQGVDAGWVGDCGRGFGLVGRD